MKIAIVDDNPNDACALQSILGTLISQQYDQDAQILLFSCTDDFIASWVPGAFSLIILDIFIDAKTGIDLANFIRRSDPDTHLVFFSSSNEFAAESYAVNATYYLTKPLVPERILNMLHRVFPSNTQQLPSVQLPDGTKIIPKLILYTEYYNHVVTLFFKQDYTHSVRISQTELELLLSEYPHFYSPIRGVLINLEEVAEYTAESFSMTDGKKIPIARRKRKEAEETFMSFRFHKLIEELNDQ